LECVFFMNHIERHFLMQLTWLAISDHGILMGGRMGVNVSVDCFNVQSK
jgi:hypothetical protein